MDDVSPRARSILTHVDLIACEDSRRTGQLLKLLGIGKKKLTSYHDHNESLKSSALIEQILSEKLSVALVSDAGTPCIADPGYKLVACAHAMGLAVRTIPGPSSQTALVAASGLPSDRVLFIGFLPSKQSALIKEVQSWLTIEASIVCFETAKRLENTIDLIFTTYPSAVISIGRELTKMYEEVIKGDENQIRAWLKERTPLKGELVLMIALNRESKKQEIDENELTQSIRKLLANGLSQKDIMNLLTDCGVGKKELYQLILNAKKVKHIKK